MCRLGVLAVAMVVGAGGCAERSSAHACDLTHLARDVSSDLRFEGVTAPLLHIEVLGWRIDEGPLTAPVLPPSPPGLPAHLPERPTPQTTIALIWVRADSSTWLVVQMFRGTGRDRWQRSLTYRELVAPPTHLRPGEDANGTWHAVQRFSKPPAARELCDFAAVSFLEPPSAPIRTVSSQWDREAWLRVVGEAPTCAVWRGA